MAFDGATIGQRITRVRTMNGQTMKDLEVLSKGAVKRDVLANIESGRKKEISVQQLIDIALALDVPRCVAVRSRAAVFGGRIYPFAAADSMPGRRFELPCSGSRECRFRRRRQMSLGSMVQGTSASFSSTSRQSRTLRTRYRRRWMTSRPHE